MVFNECICQAAKRTERTDKRNLNLTTCGSHTCTLYTHHPPDHLTTTCIQKRSLSVKNVAKEHNPGSTCVFSQTNSWFMTVISRIQEWFQWNTTTSASRTWHYDRKTSMSEFFWFIPDPASLSLGPRAQSPCRSRTASWLFGVQCVVWHFSWPSHKSVAQQT